MSKVGCCLFCNESSAIEYYQKHEVPSDLIGEDAVTLSDMRCGDLLKPDSPGLKESEFDVHYFCLLFASNLEQAGKNGQGVRGFLIEDILKECRRGKKLKCTFCKKTGATIGCNVMSCGVKFHFNCGRENGTFHLFYDKFRSYCPEHADIEWLIPNGLIENRYPKVPLMRPVFSGCALSVCLICEAAVPAKASRTVIRTDCCHENLQWYHINCIRKLAIKFGDYAFKCPHCSDRKRFRTIVNMYGVYIPVRDAAWENEEMGFDDDLNDRRLQCDAMPNCFCKHVDGRLHFIEHTEWDIEWCCVCGYQGLHRHCANKLKLTIPWTCLSCSGTTAETVVPQDDIQA